MRKLAEYVSDFFEPVLFWLIAHPIMTTLIVAVLVWWVGQAYKHRWK